MQIADDHAFSGCEEKGPEQGGDLRIGEMMQKSGTENEITAFLPQRGPAHITLKDGDLGKMESLAASDFADRGVHVNGQHAERISRSSVISGKWRVWRRAILQTVGSTSTASTRREYPALLAQVTKATGMSPEPLPRSTISTGRLSVFSPAIS